MNTESRSVDPLKLKLLVETAALRTMLINLYVERFSGLPDPVAAAKGVKDSLSLTPTQPPAAGNRADPALSDMITGMTDEAVDGIMQSVIKRLESRLVTG